MSHVDASPSSTKPPAAGSWPLYGWAGLGLILVSWPLNWLLPGLRSHLLFFPLWLGYILTVDALVLRRSGSSLLRRSPADLARLFLVSVPVWWLFEALNLRLRNWEYPGSEHFGPQAYFLLSSIAYSTVIPAVFETAELLATLPWSERLNAGRPFAAGRRLRLGLFGMGVAMLALLLVWPRIFYPFAWLSLLFLFDPLAHAIGRPSLLAHLEAGRRRPLLMLALGALACGFFWELWNYHAYPKWTYNVPGLDFAHLFEMPLPGYLGYLPFGLELYPFTHLLLPRPPALRL
ncbi:MAG: hypothetical protein O7A04_03295 [Acidobacteria bacterium]|nr:hypothetical protein [Acidobacteriota bacterium]